VPEPTRLSDLIPRRPAGGEEVPPVGPAWVERECQACHGAGVVLVDDGSASRIYGGGRLVPCPRCDAGRQARERHLRSLDGMNDEQRLMSFANFEPEENAAALHAVRWATQLRHGVIVLTGTYGVGKTHLLSAAVNASRDDAQGTGLAVYVTMPELMNRIRKGIDHHEDVVARYVSLPVLALDEFGRQHMTDWGREQMFRIVDGRYLAARSKLTLVASNDEPAEWPGYVRSRFTDRRCQVLRMGGADNRPRMEWGK